MVLPSKNANYKNSVISKFPIILSILKEEKICKIIDLQNKTKNHFSSISEFVQTMDCLFALGKIEINDTKDGVYIC